MVIRLDKINKKTTDVVLIERDNNLIRKKEGKLGKPISFSSTSNCGTNENAVLQVENLIKEYQKKGYTLVDNVDNEINEAETFDKAKWHLDGDFPKELDQYQAYVHTGFFIGWLILNNLISEEFRIENKRAIESFMNKKITAVKLYEEQLDGVFTSSELNDHGLMFTKKYFDFENGSYLLDYEKTLALNLPTLFHVQDTWSNFELLCKILDNRYKDFSISL